MVFQVCKKKVTRINLLEVRILEISELYPMGYDSTHGVMNLTLGPYSQKLVHFKVSKYDFFRGHIG